MDQQLSLEYAWSIGGVYERAWFERPAFRMVRYMNMNGAGRKFDINSYIKSNKVPETN